MNFTDLNKLKEEGHYFLVDKEIKEIQNCISINGVVPLQITSSFSYDKSKEIDVKLIDGINIGKIKFLKAIEVIDTSSLPDDDFICFLTEYNKSTIIDSGYKFNNDFLILKEEHLNNYLENFKKSSAIWGSFFHLGDKPLVEFSKKANIPHIQALQNIEINNPIYLENLSLSVDEPNPINRFLKLYHLLELQFDLHTAVIISRLLEQGNREKEISSKLRDYTKDEDERLESLIKERCTNLSRLVFHLNHSANYLNESITIFYEFGKTKNPLKREHFISLTSGANKFEKVAIDAIGGYSYNSLIPKLAAYWIYRIRCCVAHNRFGEYILTVSDEEFIVEFAEPLLKEVIIQCFEKKIP